MNSSLPVFREPTPVEKLFNRVLGALIGRGIGPAHIYLLEVRGRKSGKQYMTPVDPLELNGKCYLVAPRGYTQWVRNAEAAGEVVLCKGIDRRKLVVFAQFPTPKSPPVLKAYLDNYRREVQRYFSVPAGSPPEAFADVASNYPAFELLAE